MATEKLTDGDMGVTKCDFEMAVESRSNKPGILMMTKAQAVAVLIVFAAIVVLVGVLCYYETKRECERKHSLLNHSLIDDHGGNGDVYPSIVTYPVTYPTPEGPWEGRLSSDVIPELYDLHIKPFINEEDVERNDHRRFTFEGDVTIRVLCQAPTSEIVMHLDNITVLDIRVVDVQFGDTNLYDEVSYDGRYSFMRIALTEELHEGSFYNVSMSYIGEIRSDLDLSGFYRSSYFDEAGNVSWMGTTQMQPVSARNALPCFDEPLMKAVFNVRITHRPHMVALSNGREVDVVDNGDGWVTTSFEPTPKMPTYLLAFVIGVLEYRETITDNGIRLRIWASPSAIDSTSFALDAHSQLLTYFEGYFNISYKLPKMDIVAIPDFRSGGMENWGLVLYPEDNLMYDPAIDSRSDQEAMLTVISHEIAHQWFGNLVTMIWWEDLWLNEGVGTYFGFIGADIVSPELGVMETMVTVDLGQVLRGDGFSISHPVRQPVSSPEEISRIFDLISYSKGAAILRMLQNVLGEGVFQDGIRSYLRKFSFSNAASTDLWDAFTEADRGHGDNDVSYLMETWTLQMGYPLINLTRLDRTQVVAQQTRYLSVNEDFDPLESPFRYTWYVYVTYTDSTARDYTNPMSFIIKDGDPYEFSLGNSVQSTDWYLVNIDAYGYYRVNYDMENWNRIIQQLKTDHEAIPILNRVQLIRDSFSLAFTGDVPFSTAFELTSYLERETRSAPWQSAVSFFVFFRDMMATTPLQGPFEDYLRTLTEHMYQRLGFNATNDKTTPDEEKTRDVVLHIACKVRNQECTDRALELYDEFMAGYNLSNPSDHVLDLNAGFTALVLCTGVREGSFKQWDYMWSLYTDPRSARSKKYLKRWLTALSCAVRPWQIRKLLLDPMQDARTVPRIDFILPLVAATPMGRTLAWDFLREYWDELQAFYGPSQRWSMVIQEVAKNLNTEIHLDELRTFLYSRDLGFGAVALAEVIHARTFSLATENEIYANIKTWLESNYV